VQIVVAGLAGAPHMIACTVIALARVLYEFAEYLDSAFLSQLLIPVVTLLRSNNRYHLRFSFFHSFTFSFLKREIISSCILFLKMAVVKIPPDVFEKQLPNMVFFSASDLKSNNYNSNLRWNLFQSIQKKRRIIFVIF
jgi:hypothetical protein